MPNLNFSGSLPTAYRSLSTLSVTTASHSCRLTNDDLITAVRECASRYSNARHHAVKTRFQISIPSFVGNNVSKTDIAEVNTALDSTNADAKAAACLEALYGGLNVFVSDASLTRPYISSLH